MATNEKTYEEMVAEAEAIKDTEAEVEGLVPVQNTTKVKEARIVYTVRLSPSELEAITAAAQRNRRTVGDFIRASALSASAGESGTVTVPSATVAQVKEQVRLLLDTTSRL